MPTNGRPQQERGALLDLDDALRPSGRILETGTALLRAFEDLAVARTEHDSTTLDLLLRLRLAPEHRLRGIDLCRQLRRSPSHVSRMIDRAEHRGLVKRQPDPEDRRAQQITLTALGEEAVDAYVPHLVDVLNQTIYAALTSNEIETLIDLLAQVTSSANQLLESQ